MRDGVLLAGDLYLPREGVFPTLLCKTPYDRTRPSVYPEIARFLDHDYAVLIVSFRGRFGSGGEANEWETEGWGLHPDGYDTVEWAGTQPWSTGAVGIYGISADGQWQLTTAATAPPHLQAAFASYAAHGRAGLMDGGVYTSVGPRWHAMTGNVRPRPREPRRLACLAAAVAGDRDAAPHELHAPWSHRHLPARRVRRLLARLRPRRTVRELRDPRPVRVWLVRPLHRLAVRALPGRARARTLGARARQPEARLRAVGPWRQPGSADRPRPLRGRGPLRPSRPDGAVVRPLAEGRGQRDRPGARASGSTWAAPGSGSSPRRGLRRRP